MIFPPKPAAPIAYMLVPMQEAGDKLVCCATGELLSMGTGKPPPLKVVSPEIVGLLSAGPGERRITTVTIEELDRLRSESANLETLLRIVFAANLPGDRLPGQESWREVLHAARGMRGRQ